MAKKVCALLKICFFLFKIFFEWLKISKKFQDSQFPEDEPFNPLTTRRSKNATLLWKIPVILVLYRYRCNFYTVENFVSAVRSKKQNHFITYTTHFRSLYVPKSRFFGKKAVHCRCALLKKRKRFLSYLLNGYRYHKNFNRFEF